MEEFKFRKAKKTDIEQLVDMRIEYLKEDLGEVTIRDEVQLRKNLQIFFEEHLNNDIDAFVALCGNEIVSTSFTSYYFRLPHPNFPKGKAGVPINGYTKPLYRKKGLAGSLLKLSADYAKDLDVELLNMEVTEKGLLVCKEIGFREIKYTPIQMILKKGETV